MAAHRKAVTYTDREKLIEEHLSGLSEEYLITYKYYQEKCPSWSLSETVYNWLGGWLSDGQKIVDLPQSVIDELQSYRLTQPTKLYRAEVTHSQIHELQTYTTPSSWTYDLNVAEQFAEDRVHDDESEIAIVSTIAMPEESLVNTTRLPQVFMKTFSHEEKEVILLPGIYSLRREN